MRAYYIVPADLLHYGCLTDALVNVTVTGAEPAALDLDGFTHTARMAADKSEAIVALRPPVPCPEHWTHLAPVDPHAISKACSAAKKWVAVPVSELTAKQAAASLCLYRVLADTLTVDKVPCAALWYDGTKPAALSLYSTRYRAEYEELAL